MFEPCCRNKLKLQVIMTIAIVITIIVTTINYLNSIIIIVTFSVTYEDVWEFSLIGRQAKPLSLFDTEKINNSFIIIIPFLINFIIIIAIVITIFIFITVAIIVGIIIGELAERSPIIIQNKIVVTHQAEKIWMYDRMTVRPYDRTTVQGATFNMRGQLYRGHANATVLSSSPVVSALGSESDDPVNSQLITS